MENTEIKNDDNDILEKMYLELCEDKKKIENEIQINNAQIEQTKKYLDTVLTEENNNLRVFSPRNPVNLYGERIKENKDLLSQFEKSNIQKYKELNLINDRLKGLKSVVNDDSYVSHETCDESKIISSNSTITVNNSQFIDILDEERQRIARDIHDSSIQSLIHVIHTVELAEKYIDVDTIRAKLELQTIEKNLREAINELRMQIYDLRSNPQETVDFKTSLENLKSDLSIRTSIDISFDIESLDTINSYICITIYKVIKECCLNTIKHSEAKSLLVKLFTINDSISLEIKDDGKGIDFSTQEQNNVHYGLSIIKERVNLLKGDIIIEADKDKGTDIKITIPMKEGQDD